MCLPLTKFLIFPLTTLLIDWRTIKRLFRRLVNLISYNIETVEIFHSGEVGFRVDCLVACRGCGVCGVCSACWGGIWTGVGVCRGTGAGACVLVGVQVCYILILILILALVGTLNELGITSWDCDCRWS